MKIQQMLFEGIKQYQIDETIRRLRSDGRFFLDNGLRGPSVFENGLCYEFALALYNYLKSIGEDSEILFLMGSMKKTEAQWYYSPETDEFDPRTDHPFHTLIQVRKFYYDINGKLGDKRNIASMWYKFRNKRLVKTTPEELKSFIKHHELVSFLEQKLKEHQLS